MGLKAGESPMKYFKDKNDSSEKQKEIKNYIGKNMSNMSDKKLMKEVNSRSGGSTEYNWNKKTGEVESHAQAKEKPKKLDIKGYLKGEQGLIPDWKGEPTRKTIKKLGFSKSPTISKALDITEKGFGGVRKK